jgi:hypothetical protein
LISISFLYFQLPGSLEFTRDVGNVESPQAAAAIIPVIQLDRRLVCTG